MSLAWVADGIERARAAGGVELELYRRPGFVGGTGVRRSDAYAGGCGFEVGWDEDPWYEDHATLARSRSASGKSGFWAMTPRWPQAAAGELHP